MGHTSFPIKPAEPTLIDLVLADLHATYQAVSSGKLADYIPELAKANPDDFGIVIATADGRIYAIGDSDKAFTIQSISKPFVFGLALEDHGRDHVLKKVGVEPSGDAFNSIIFDERANRPFNPMVNAGAIATTALIRGEGGAERLNRVLAMFERFTGHPVNVDVSVFLSEKATGHRNRAIGHLELNFGMVDNRVEEHLDLYFQQCSVQVTCRDLAVMAATLANGGVNPLTGQRAIQADYVKNVVAVMNSCGMYDYSGEWSYRIGLPAKSGVGGGIVAVLPGRMGIGIFSPPLDERGNSVRGIKICEALSQRFGLNMFDATRNLAPSVRRQYNCGSVGSRRTRNADQRAFLDQSGHRVNVLELRGSLSFAAIEQVNSGMAALPADTTHVILDFARVDEIEPVAAELIASLIELQTGFGRAIRLAQADDGRQRLTAAGIGADYFFADLDQALEWAEEQLLAEAQVGDPLAERPLAEMDLVAGLTDDHLALLSTALERCEFAAGAVVMSEGDPATRLYFLAKGMVSIVMNAGSGRAKRLSTLNSGVAFGEMALLDGGHRSADVLADTDVVAYALDLDRLNAFAETHPAIQATLLRNLGRVLSQRLRKANSEIRSLE